MGSPFVSVAVK